MLLSPALRHNILMKTYNTKKLIAIVDLECTCDNSENPKISRQEMEIIEIGCVIADYDGNVIAEFDRFIKPVINPILTDFCKELTTITQEQVKSGVTLPQAINELLVFLKEYSVETWGSWGGFDKNQVIREYALKNFPVPQEFVSLNHINLSYRYTQKNNLKKSGVRKSLNRHHIKFVGTPHRGIDDVKNIAKLLPFIF